MKEILRIGFQGEPGSYSEISAIRYFTNFDCEQVPFKSFQDLFDAVESSIVDAAIVPIENSIEGSVNEAYDLLVEKPLYITGEIYQKIIHCLIVNKKYDDNITTVYSHPQALAQCRNYIRKKSLKSIPSYDTAGSVKIIKENSLFYAAAIASKRAAELYDMKIVEEGIQDKINNFTRFLVVSKKPNNDINDNNKTSIIFSLTHKPGTLFSILKEFAIRDINLTKIESRPTKSVPWEYYFFVDFEGNMYSPKIQELLLNVKQNAIFFKILGSYKKDKLL